MTANEIKSLMALRGITCTEVARDLGISINAVSQVARRIGRSARIEAELARRLGLSAESIFGSPPRHRRPPIASQV